MRAGEDGERRGRRGGAALSPPADGPGAVPGQRLTDPAGLEVATCRDGWQTSGETVRREAKVRRAGAQEEAKHREGAATQIGNATENIKIRIFRPCTGRSRPAKTNKFAFAPDLSLYLWNMAAQPARDSAAAGAAGP